MVIRRESRRNGDRFPKQQTPKAQGSRGEPGARFPGNFFFFLRVIHNKLTDFRKTVETGLDPHLVIVLASCIIHGYLVYFSSI